MSGNLLETILADAELLARLQSSGALRQTITVMAPRSLGPAALPGIPAPANPVAGNPVAGNPVAGNPVAGNPAPQQPMHRLPTRNVALQGQRAVETTDYRLLGSLGRGGTAVVYQAHQRAVDREVAVKVLHDNLVNDPLAQQRFLAEAKTVGGLDHPNVIALHELATSDSGQLFYSMKRIDGASWAATIEDRTIEENLTILMRVADAIRYAHSRGLLHRDIKPENVMLGRFGEVLVADWGLALPYPAPLDGDPTQSIGGTPAYMAPEQAAGSLQALGVPTDIYLLGAVLFHILSGYPPHHGETLMECLQAAAKNKIRPTRVTGALMDIALRATQTQPADRYASVESFQQAVRTYQTHQESVRLVHRAQQYASEATHASGYEKYGLALNLLSEAMEIWPGNQRGAQALTQVRVEFARRALSQGDFDLALSLLEAAGEGDSELASRVRRRRSSRQQRIKREARLQILFSHSPDAVLLTRLDNGEILEANEVFLNHFGFELENIVGKSVPDLDLWLCPERRGFFLKELKSRGRIDNFEAQFRDSHGAAIDILISGRTLMLEGQQVLVTNLRDVTQRKLAEDELVRSRQRLREFTRLAQLGTWEYNVATKQVHWNSELYALTGLERGEQSPDLDSFMQTVHPDDRKRLLSKMTRAMQTGEPYELRSRHRLPSGGYRSVIARGQAIRDKSGKVIEIYGTVHDITQQMADIEHSKATIAAMQQLVDWSREPICSLNADGTVLAMSSSFAAALGIAFQPSRSALSIELDGEASAAGPVRARFRQDQQDAGDWMPVSLHASSCDSIRLAQLLTPGVGSS